MGGPLEGIRVVDWTQWQQGPSAAALLGDLGADVIKIERPGIGDAGRGLRKVTGVTVMRDDWNLYFEVLNRSKRGMTLDLTKEEGREIIYDLIAKSDVFINNARLGIGEKLKVGWDDLSQVNPRLVYVMVTGLGPRGPDAMKPSYDFNFQARSGFMAAIAEAGTAPIYGPVGMADQVGGVFAAFGALAGLVAREKTGEGQLICSSSLSGMLWAMGWVPGVALILGEVAPKPGRLTQDNPIYNHYMCKDGKWLILSMHQSDRFWADFCKVVGREDLATNPKYSDPVKRAEHHTELIKTFEDIFATKGRDEWLRIIQEGGDFPSDKLNLMEEAFEDEQVLANDYVVNFDHPVHGTIKMVGIPLEFSSTPAKLRIPAPEIGQHTEEILSELLGYSWEKIEKLRKEGTI